jgi:uncharacterized protein YjlB
MAVVFSARDVARLRAATQSHAEGFYAIVILGQVLSLPTGAQLSQIGSSGDFQIAGGFSPTDRRPAEVARVLHSPLFDDPAVPGDL